MTGSSVGGVAQPQGDDEGHRPRLAPERLVQRQPGLAQREVERRRLEAPGPVAARGLAGRRLGPEVSRLHARAEVARASSPGQPVRRPGGLQDVVVLAVVGDVLADALLAAAAQADHGRLAGEVARDVALQRLERADVDAQRQRREPREEPARSLTPRALVRAAAAPAARRARRGAAPRALADRLELAGAELDQRAALADEVERLAQAGLAGVQPADDRLRAARWPTRRSGRSRRLPSVDGGLHGIVVEEEATAPARRASAAEGQHRPVAVVDDRIAAATTRSGSWASSASASLSSAWRRAAPRAPRRPRSPGGRAPRARARVSAALVAAPRQAAARSSRSCWCRRVRWRATCSARGARQPRQRPRALEDRTAAMAVQAARPRASSRGARLAAVQRHGGLGGVGRRGAAHRGDVVEQRAVGVVADRGDDRHAQQRDRAAQRLVAEAQEVGQRAAAAGDDHDLDLGEGGQLLQGAGDARRRVAVLHGREAQTTRPPQPRQRSSASTSSRALPPSP